MDPMWAQVGVMVVLVGVTIYYAYQVRKSNENAWVLEGNRREHEIELEVRRKNEEIDQLRKLIFTEINVNNNYILSLLAFIKKAKEGYKKGEVYFPVKFPYQDITYKTFFKEIGNLPTTEAWNIMRIYTFLQRIDFIFNTFLKDLEKTVNAKKSLEYMNYIFRLDYLEKVTSDVKMYMNMQIEYYIDVDKGFSKFEERFNKSVKRKVRF